VRECAVIFLMLSIPVLVSGQKDTVRHIADTSGGRAYLLQQVERNGETLPEVNIKEVTVVGRKGVPRKVLIRRNDRLTYNLKKVYPYAVIVREKLYQVEQDLAAITDEKERRKYLKGVEESVLGEYEDDMRDMTITQGRLLIKMIDRETRNTSFELIKEFRGGFSASFWQGIARIFGTNLKAEYDPWGEDAMMEIILLEIEAGLI
jgi:hypothetical protein